MSQEKKQIFNEQKYQKDRICNACGVPEKYHGNRCGWPNAYKPEEQKYLNTYLESHNK